MGWAWQGGGSCLGHGRSAPCALFLSGDRLSHLSLLAVNNLLFFSSVPSFPYPGHPHPRPGPTTDPWGERERRGSQDSLGLGSVPSWCPITMSLPLAGWPRLPTREDLPFGPVYALGADSSSGCRACGRGKTNMAGVGAQRGDRGMKNPPGILLPFLPPQPPRSVGRKHGAYRTEQAPCRTSTLTQCCLSSESVLREDLHWDPVPGVHCGV